MYNNFNSFSSRKINNAKYVYSQNVNEKYFKNIERIQRIFYKFIEVNCE